MFARALTALSCRITLFFRFFTRESAEIEAGSARRADPQDRPISRRDLIHEHVAFSASLEYVVTGPEDDEDDDDDDDEPKNHTANRLASAVTPTPIFDRPPRGPGKSPTLRKEKQNRGVKDDMGKKNKKSKPEMA